MEQNMKIVYCRKVSGFDQYYYDPSFFKTTNKVKLHPRQTVIATLDTDGDIGHYERFSRRVKCGRKRTVNMLYPNTQESLGLMLANVSRKPNRRVIYVPPNTLLSDVLKNPDVNSKFTTMHTKEEDEDAEPNESCDDECDHSDDEDDMDRVTGPDK